jgi:hypothetical protein
MPNAIERLPQAHQKASMVDQVGWNFWCSMLLQIGWSGADNAPKISSITGAQGAGGDDGVASLRSMAGQDAQRR